MNKENFEYNVNKSCQIKNLKNIYTDVFGYKTDGLFVEIGAYDGESWSNTDCFGKIGWRGLLVEPVPEFFQKCKKYYEMFPKIEIVNCCVGNYNGEIKVYLGGSITTTSLEMVDIYNGIKWSKPCGLNKKKFINSKIFTLDYLLEKYEWPENFDVLVIDTEGTELEVLNGFNIEKWGPKLAIVESCEKHLDKILSVKSAEINNFFLTKGYEKIYCDCINSIYIKNF